MVLEQITKQARNAADEQDKDLDPTQTEALADRVRTWLDHYDVDVPLATTDVDGRTTLIDGHTRLMIVEALRYGGLNCETDLNCSDFNTCAEARHHLNGCRRLSRT